MPRAREPGFADRWRWFRETYCTPWLKSIGAPRSSIRALAEALDEKNETLASWERQGCTPDRLRLERIAEKVGAPDPPRMAAYLVTGVGEAPAPAGELVHRTPPGGIRIEDLPEDDPRAKNLESVLLALKAGRLGVREAAGTIRGMFKAGLAVIATALLTTVPSRADAASQRAEIGNIAAGAAPPRRRRRTSQRPSPRSRTAQKGRASRFKKRAAAKPAPKAPARQVLDGLAVA